MKLYFPNREKARAFPSGKLVDAGKDSPKRWAKDLSKSTTKSVQEK